MKHLPYPMRELFHGFHYFYFSADFLNHIGYFVSVGILSNETLTISNERVFDHFYYFNFSAVF